MSNLLEKVKENGLQIFFGVISGLLTVIATYVGSLVLPVLASIPNNVLLALLALSLLLNVGLWFYISHLSKQVRNLQDTKFTKGFGVLWDKDREPHCPVCKNLLSPSAASARDLSPWLKAQARYRGLKPAFEPVDLSTGAAMTEEPNFEKCQVARKLFSTL